MGDLLCGLLQRGIMVIILEVQFYPNSAVEPTVASIFRRKLER